MGRCACCGKEIRSVDEKVYAIIERYHYDNRQNTAQTDTGPTKYSPIAIIRAGLCEDCNREAGSDILSYGGQRVAIGLALMFFAGAFAAATGDGSIVLLALLGVIVLISGAVKIIKVFAGRATGKGDNTVTALGGILKPEIVLYPPTDKAIDVQSVQGSLVNRDHYEYYFYGEGILHGSITGKAKANSKDEAIETLRRWARKIDLVD